MTAVLTDPVPLAERTEQEFTFGERHGIGQYSGHGSGRRRPVIGF